MFEPRVDSSHGQKDGEERPVGEQASDHMCDFRKGENMKARLLVELQQPLAGFIISFTQNTADSTAALFSRYLEKKIKTD